MTKKNLNINENKNKIIFTSCFIKAKRSINHLYLYLQLNIL